MVYATIMVRREGDSFHLQIAFVIFCSHFTVKLNYTINYLLLVFIGILSLLHFKDSCLKV